MAAVTGAVYVLLTTEDLETVLSVLSAYRGGLKQAADDTASVCELAALDREYQAVLTITRRLEKAERVGVSAN